MYDFLVIGKGLFGSAAARYLTYLPGKVAILGPDEPTDPRGHSGVFASHYDQGRIVSSTGPDAVWTALDRLAISEYGTIQKEGGISFHRPNGLIRACRQPGGSSKGQDSGKSYRYPEDGSAARLSSREILRRYQVQLPTDYDLFVEAAPSGYINPRDLIRAQLSAGERRGLAVIRETAAVVHPEDGHITVTTLEGGRVRASKVLLAVGAYTNSFDLLQRKLALRVKTETIVLARVPRSEARRLSGMPAINYEYADETLWDIYMLPPIRYPDGKYYVKMGCNNAYDQWPETFNQMGDWMRGGSSDEVLPAMRSAVEAILPGLAATRWQTRRCLVTYTPHGRPYIDEVVPGKVFVAAAGNGKGAHPSDGIGRLAADLLSRGQWDFEFGQDLFRVEYAAPP